MAIYEVCVRRTEEIWYSVDALTAEAAEMDYLDGEETFSKLKESTVVDVRPFGDLS